MSNYDVQYQVEDSLFGAPYDEFEQFVKLHAKSGATALDLGCGQGRDALMLAKYGYAVTGVDSSQVGISQMVTSAKRDNLDVKGVIGNLFEYAIDETYDAIVLDSILHFAKADLKQELTLLDRLIEHISVDGYLFIFIHKAAKKESELLAWYSKVKNDFAIAKAGYIDYVYEENASGFRSNFQYFMLILQRWPSHN